MNRFTHDQIAYLCSQYLAGQLSRLEEKSLYLILKESDSLTDGEREILALIEAESQIYRPTARLKPRKWLYSGVAAGVCALTAISIPLYLNHLSNQTDETYVVWENGKQITGDEARQKAEEKQKEDMEMIRIMMKQQREMMKRNYASIDADQYDY